MVGYRLRLPERRRTGSAGWVGAEPRGFGCRNEFGRRGTARRPSGTTSPWESTWRAWSSVCLNIEQLLVGTGRKAVTPYLQG